MLLPLCCILFVACTSEYDADTAESNYKPITGKQMVASVKTSESVDGRDYVWAHQFSYDAKGRIKSVKSDVKSYRAVEYDNATDYLEYTALSTANYIYNGAQLEVEFSFKLNYPSSPSLNTSGSSKDSGHFNRSGALTRFSALDFVYSGSILRQAYDDYGVYYTIERDGENVVSHSVFETESDSHISTSKRYFYSPIANETNFDFSAYLGYWGVERSLGLRSDVPYYALYQLGAFGMLGTTSKELPWGVIENGKRVYGEWSYDSKGRPSLFVDADGVKTEVTYAD